MRGLGLCFLLLATNLPLPLPAQTSSVLRGRVLDAATHQPLPNAQVGVAGHRLGTSTNGDGRFVLPIPPAEAHAQLTVALLGYRSHRQPLPPLNGAELIINLKVSPQSLGEVQVSSSALGIVREAVARIPRNYPVRSTQLTGFYRESDNNLDDGRYRYLGEAVLTVFKAPYNQPKANGEVVIQQSRKVDLQGQKAGLNWAWYAGPFIPQRFDFVHNRLDFINEADFQDYDYQLTPQTTYHGQPVYVIQFGPKAGSARANFAGRLYIAEQSYVFLAAEWHRTPAGIRRELNNFNSEERAYRVDYQSYAGRWHLKKVWYHTVGKALLGRVRIRHLSEFLTTAIDTAQLPAPGYAARAQFFDVFRDQAPKAGSIFWDDQTLGLLPDSLRPALLDPERQQQAETLFAAQAAQNQQPARKLWSNFLRRVRFIQGAGGFARQTTATDWRLRFLPAGSAFEAQAQRHIPGAGYSFFLQSGYQLDLAPGFSVYYLGRQLVGSFCGTGNEFGATYAHNFAPQHRPLTGRIGAAYTRQRLRYDFGTFANPDPSLVVVGTKLKADEISVAAQEFTAAWQLRLGVGVELSRRLEAIADLGFLLPQSTRRELHLAEESGFFLWRNEADLALPAGATALTSNAPARPWTLNSPLLSVSLLFRLQ